MRVYKFILLTLILAGITGCSSGPADEAVTETGPKVPEEQLGKAGGPGPGDDQKGDFKPLPPN